MDNTHNQGKSVITPDGPGIIADAEFYSRLNGGMYRYGVTLERNPYFYPVAYYAEHEVKFSD